ncbi:tetratricopeptide repeat protein [Novipirellula sp.]|uniref:tetratricopeptide repeat protein n=1 Tax=Novipirellula sp. TaxID=2795430 RepID=UPI0035625309
MNAHLQRALMLLGQSRHEMAIDELRQLLAVDPDNAMGHAVLAICFSETKQYADAQSESELAIHLAPDQPFVFYAQSIVLANRNQYAAAQAAIETAVGLDPYNPDYFAKLAEIQFNQHRWKETLEAAELGLSLDAESVGCTNLRAMALVKLGRKIEAEEAIGAALKRAPEDEYAHANMGWTLLEQNQPEKAMEHFREALRLNPEMDWARAGIIEAMKSRYFIYRIMLNWFLWMQKLQQKAQWGVIIGAYIGFRLLSGFADDHPEWSPWLQPLLIAYIAFALMTWVASPLFNLVLRTSKFGRLALSEHQIRSSTWVGVCVLSGIVLVAGYFVTGSSPLLGCALACMLLIPPLGRIYSCQEGWPRATLSLTTIALGFLAVVVVASSFGSYFIEGNVSRGLRDIAGLFFTPLLYGSIAAQFLTNALVSVSPKRGTDTGKMVWIIGGTLLGLAALAVMAFIGLVIVVGLQDAR